VIECIRDMCGKTANLHISLDGNRVVHVDDDALPVARKGAVDFSDSGERQTGYTYNTCGILYRCSLVDVKERS